MKKTTLKKQRIREYSVIFAAAIAIVAGTVTAGAAGFNTGGLLSGVETALKAVPGITGGGLAVSGVIHLIEAQGNQDPQAKNNAIKQLASGLGLIIVASIIIPVFIGAITL